MFKKILLWFCKNLDFYTLYSDFFLIVFVNQWYHGKSLWLTENLEKNKFV